MANAVKTTRKALYQRVWSEPVLKLAKEHGLSGVGFAKLCKRNEIPRPPRGFWAKKAAGHNPRTEPLPRPEADWEIKITPSETAIADPTLRSGGEKELAQSVPAEPIVVPESLRGAHPLVSQSLHALEFAEKGEQGIIRPPAIGCANR